jgi:hypothetical protein
MRGAMLLNWKIPMGPTEESPFLQTKPEAKAPEVHRNTPFELDRTADPAHAIMTAARPIPPLGVWTKRAGTSETHPAVPAWMAAPQPRSAVPGGPDPPRRVRR